MKPSTWRAPVLAVIITIAGSSATSAREPAGTVADLQDRLKTGAEVDLVDTSGGIVRGQFVRADDEGVLVTPYGSSVSRLVPARDVYSVIRPGDSVRNGALIGAAVGLVPLALLADETGDFAKSEAISAVTTYAAIGALIDYALKGRTVVFRAAGNRGERAGAMAELDGRVRPGTEIEIIERNGRVVRGEFARADSEGVLISVLGSATGRRVAAGDVMRITRDGDSLRNGTLIGAGIGLGFGLLVMGTDPDPGNGVVWCEGSSCARWLAMSTSTYAGVGALIDLAIKGRTVVYRAPANRVSWSVTPHPVARGAGIRVALAF